jgi:hypothetical protein
MFEIGQRVVCVDDTPKWYPTAGVKRGEIYVVTRVHHSPRHGGSVELQGTPSMSLLGFYAERFRPVDETRLDIFRAMLTETPAQVETTNV